MGSRTSSTLSHNTGKQTAKHRHSIDIDDVAAAVRGQWSWRATALVLLCLTVVHVTARSDQSTGSPSRVLKTKRGSLQGSLVNNGPYLAPVESYLGVPYAAPPTRFMPPTSPPTWTGVRQATTHAPVCPQRLPDLTNRTAALTTMSKQQYNNLIHLQKFVQKQSEDCLYLNIYTPATGEGNRNRYPVLVYVHGDSFDYGSGNALDGSVLASYGAVVVVTINYRLGMLGFLNANFEPVRAVANYGLLDIVAALEFIRLTVEEFGGDPVNVTVVGHAAGAACINHLMTSSSAPLGVLFHRAVLMSGTSLAPWALLSDPLNATRQLAELLQCRPVAGVFLPCLRSKPLQQLLAAPVVGARFVPVFGPSLDGIVIGDEFFTSPAAYVHRLSSYELMVGVSGAEASRQLSGLQLEAGLSTAERDRVLRTFVRNSYSYHLNELLSTIRHQYTDWTQLEQDRQQLRDQLLEVLADAQYVAPAAHTASLVTSSRNTYFYVLNTDNTTQMTPCDEIALMFGYPLKKMSSHSNEWSQDDRTLSMVMMTYWSNFAKSGDPNSPREPLASDGTRVHPKVKWSSYGRNHRKYILLGRESRMQSHYRAQKVALWLQLIPEIHRRGRSGISGVTHHLLDDHELHHLYQGSVRAVPATWRPLPPATTTFPAATNVSAVLDGSLAGPALAGSSDEAPLQVSGLDALRASYSTALGITVAIGGSLLVLNMLVLAAIYHQRQKQRAQRCRCTTAVRAYSPSSECELAAAEPRVRTASSYGSCADGMHEAGRRAGQLHAQPPPEFADYPCPGDQSCSRRRSGQFDQAQLEPRRCIYNSGSLPRNLTTCDFLQETSTAVKKPSNSREQLTELTV